jgi:phage FluMu protein Com
VSVPDELLPWRCPGRLRSGAPCGKLLARVGAPMEVESCEARTSMGTLGPPDASGEVDERYVVVVQMICPKCRRLNTLARPATGPSRSGMLHTITV